jgi:outer membrane protein OmpA-like peptidoglycan-associated protein
MGATALAQAMPDQSIPPAAATQSAPSIAATDPAHPGSMNSDENATYATGKPLAENESKEGFWGHLNPFARKKWVRREVDPIKERANELDQLQARNANDIRDVDQRATAGINNAMMAANTADQHAADAANRANAAQMTASNANSRTDALNGTVSALDQYQKVAATDVPFAAGRTTLGPKGKADLDLMASALAGEKGYIIEIQGYSRGGVQTSQEMADAVARYLVAEKQVPLYRIYRTGLGKDSATPADGDTAIVNGVRVTLLHNSLASMDANAASNLPQGQMGPAQDLAQGSMGAPNQ